MTRTRLALTTGAAFVLLIAIVGSLITDESHPQAFPEPAGNGDGNGLIAYSYEGDIYIGDPVSGETTAIVTNPTYEVIRSSRPTARGSRSYEAVRLAETRRS